MAYVADWERLSDALGRVMAMGLSREEAQRDICLALADGKIRFRARVGHAEDLLGHVIPHPFPGGPLVPTDLGLTDIDWRESRPKNLWLDGNYPFLKLRLTLMELDREDVTRILCGGTSQAERASRRTSPAPWQEAGAGKKPRDPPVTGIGSTPFNQSEWITLNQAAEILRLERDATDSGQLRLIELLRRKRDIARVLAPTFSPPVTTEESMGLEPMPDWFAWVVVDQVDWATSTVSAYPFPSGTSRPDQKLDIRVSRAAVLETAEQEQEAEERSRRLKREVAMRLFGELFWPPARVVSWIGFRDPQLIEASVRTARLYRTSSLGQALRERDAGGIFLRALQDGTLRALRGGNELLREFWATATGRNWPEDVRFRREDVLALWSVEAERPEAQPSSSDSGATAEPARTDANSALEAAEVRNEARTWRANRIKRFELRQRLLREWISFAEIADWCSKESGSIVPDERRRAVALDTLANDLLTGEFEENGRSRVLYLHAWTVKARMTRGSLKDAIEHDYDGQRGRSEYLPHCWIPRRMFDGWLSKHRLERSPLRFEPQSRHDVSSQTPGDDIATVPTVASRPKSSPTLERARIAISELYPGGVPGQPQEPNAILCRRVGDRLKRTGQQGVSNDTVLRAAGRRR